MELSHRVIDVRVPDAPEGVVLVLHGGASRRGHPMVSPTQLSVLRMIPIARRIARIGQGRLAVLRLLNSVRGWDSEHTPAQDARWALARIAERFGLEVPVCLVGHSLGGRAAILAAAEPAVAGVAALAPWVYATDVPPGLGGDERLLIVHGDRDRIASPQRSRALARALAARADVGYVLVEGGTHAMLRRRDAFDGLAASFAASVLLDAPEPEPLARVTAGEPLVRV